MRLMCVSLVFTLIAAACAATPIVMASDDAPALSEDIISRVNTAGSSWTAGWNSKFAAMTVGQARDMLGVLPHSRRMRLPRKSTSTSSIAPNDIPASFDARLQWPSCASIRHVRDQGPCGSCWAFGAAEAMSDRICISSGQINQTEVSAQDLVSCCDDCGAGCGGGDPSAAWDWWVSDGIVSEDTYPYAFKPCEHHMNGTKPPCGPSQPTPSCNASAHSSPRLMGSRAYYIGAHPLDIQTELLQHGPVEASFTVYADFLAYKSGVYKHVAGQLLGGHSVRLLGWGTDAGQDYWIIANSWNEDWGLNGFFHIARGSDECGIEDECNAGTPAH